MQWEARCPFRLIAFGHKSAEVPGNVHFLFLVKFVWLRDTESKLTIRKCGIKYQIGFLQFFSKRDRCRWQTVNQLQVKTYIKIKGRSSNSLSIIMACYTIQYTHAIISTCRVTQLLGNMESKIFYKYINNNFLFIYFISD
jgi:hypothetical protein